MLEYVSRTQTRHSFAARLKRNALFRSGPRTATRSNTHTVSRTLLRVFATRIERIAHLRVFLKSTPRNDSGVPLMNLVLLSARLLFLPPPSFQFHRPHLPPYALLRAVSVSFLVAPLHFALPFLFGLSSPFCACFFAISVMLTTQLIHS